MNNILKILPEESEIAYIASINWNVKITRNDNRVYAEIIGGVIGAEYTYQEEDEKLFVPYIYIDKHK